MGVRKDLKRAKRRADLAGRTSVETVRDEHGTVREVRTEVLAAHPVTGTTADVPFTNADEAPDAVVLRREEGGAWRPVTAAAFAGEVTAVAKGLVAAGLEPGPAVEAPFTLAGGREAGHTLFAEGVPDAVFTASDEQAAGLLRAAYERGLRVPEDVAVVAFDGTRTAEHTVPSLTVVTQPLDEVATRAVEAATRADRTPARHVVELSLTRRASCGCPPDGPRP